MRASSALRSCFVLALLASPLASSACVDEENARPAAPVASVSATPAAPPPTRARWSFASVPKHAVAKLLLPGGGAVYALEGGRRMVVNGATAKEASTLLPATAIAATKVGDKFAWVTVHGDVMVTHEAEASVSALHRPPHKLEAVAAGGGVILGIDERGELLRSTDAGANWNAVASPASPIAHLLSVALDDMGQGLLLAAPQRLFRTTDAGATWTKVGDPAIAILRVRAVESGLVVDVDGGHLPLLANGTLGDKVGGHEVSFPLPTPDTHGHSFAIAGDRALRFARKEKGAVDVELGPLGGALKASATRAFDGCQLPIDASGNGDVIVASCVFEEGGKRGSRIVTSKDGGVTFARELEDEKNLHFRGLRPVTVGPGGFAVIAARCPETWSTKGCAPTMVRASSIDAWKPIASGDEAFELIDAAYDVPGKRVFLLARYQTRVALFEGPLGAWPGAPKLVHQEKAGYSHTGYATWVRSDGSVWFATAEDGALRLRKVGAGDAGVVTPKLDAHVSSASFHGEHGLALAGENAFETADGGVTWQRVNAPSTGEALECTDAGCATHSALRTGWDIPATKDDPVLAAWPTPAPHTAPAKSSEVKGYECSSGKTISKLGAYGYAAATGDSTTRWTYSTFDRRGGTPVQLGKKDGATGANLFTGTKTGRVHSHTETHGNAVIGARYTLVAEKAKPKAAKPEPTKPTPTSDDDYGPGIRTSYRPVEVELAWVDFDKPAVHRARIAEVPPFRVPFRRGGFGASVVRVDGGLLFEPYGSGEGSAAKLYFAHDDGKVEELPAPPAISFEHAIRSKEGITIYQADGSSTLLASLGAGETTWKTASFRTGTNTNFGDLISSRSGALLVLGDADRNPFAIQPLPLSASARELVEPAKLPTLDFFKLPACTAADDALPVVQSSSKEVITLELSGKSPTSFRSTSEVYHLRRDGSVCSAAVIAADSENATMIVPTADPAHATLFQIGEKSAATAASCKRP